MTNESITKMYLINFEKNAPNDETLATTRLKVALLCSASVLDRITKKKRRITYLAQ